MSLRATIVGACLLALFDGLVSGQGGLALFLLIWVILVRLPLLALAWKNKPLLVFRAKKIAVYLVAISLVFGWVAFNRELGGRRAREVVAAVEAYALRHGQYPATLEQVVPEFLAAVPLANLTFVENQFKYRVMPGGVHWLTWTVVPPFGRQNYVFEEKRWFYLD